ncbi:outer membrane protein assembly factor BamA [Pelagibacteraceae bacterium]|nr:outer membrane protein assembly factor BamA [Pelagibacteraceae bacterium]
MKKFYLYLLLLLIVGFNTFATENIINSIQIEGTQRIDIETVESYSQTSIGDIYTEDLGNLILKRLFETNLFSNIQISYSDGTLNIILKENPTINFVKFVGNSKIKDEDLLIEISLKERSVYSRSKVKKDIERMLTLYQRSGRLSSEINPKIETLDNNRVNLIYEITESDIAKVSKIIILGNEVFSSSKIKSTMKTKEKRFLRFLSSSDNYDPDKLEYDKQLITQFYSNNGYPNFKIISSIAQLKPNSNNFEIIINVNEGKKFNFGKLSIESKLKKMNTDAVADVLPIKNGELFDRSKIRKSIDELKEWAQAEGYTFIDIATDLSDNQELNEIDVKLIINEGPRVYVDNINIAGNTRTVDRVIRREISLSEGDAYNKYSISYSKDSIRALNFFSKVEIEEVKTSFPDKINLEISVDEKNTGEASIGAGYSSATDASLQLGLRENNFLGKGQKVKFESSLSDTRTTYDVSFTEPYFNNKQLSLTGNVYSNFTDPASVNYETEDLGFGLSTNFPLSADRFIEIRYSLFTSKVKADSNATAYENALAGTDTISSLGYSLSLDRRNSRYKPSKGFNLILNQDLAGLGGNSYYYKNSFELNSYKRLSENFIGALKLRAGNINGYNGKYSPLASNFKLGGKKLRGFKSGKVGPKLGNSYTGGQYYYLTSLETNIDLNIDAFDITSTFFIDFGSVWGLDNPGYGSIDDKHEARSSVGLNFNWDSAIGPINIIYAQILQSNKNDTTDNLYFDIGYNF